jgi:hypothetical protein
MKKLILILILLPAWALADSEGPNSPSSSSANGIDWEDIDSVFVSDNERAYNPNDTSAHKLRAYNFGFSIPAGATIDGILVEIEGWGDEANPARRVYNVALGNSGYTILGDYKGAGAADTLPQSAGETYMPQGGSSDNWGYGSWTPAIVNSSDFSLIFKDDTVTVNYGGFYIDHFRVTVYYTPTATTKYWKPLK